MACLSNGSPWRRMSVSFVSLRVAQVMRVCASCASACAPALSNGAVATPSGLASTMLATQCAFALCWVCPGSVGIPQAESAAAPVLWDTLGPRTAVVQPCLEMFSCETLAQTRVCVQNRCVSQTFTTSGGVVTARLLHAKGCCLAKYLQL